MFHRDMLVTRLGDTTVVNGQHKRVIMIRLGYNWHNYAVEEHLSADVGDDVTTMRLVELNHNEPTSAQIGGKWFNVTLIE